MKKIVVTTDLPTVNIKEIKVSNVYAYVTETGNLFVLTKLGYKYVANDYGKYHYGFVAVGKTNDNPSFQGDKPQDAIQRALNCGRSVLEFNNLSALLHWKLKVETEKDT